MIRTGGKELRVCVLFHSFFFFFLFIYFWLCWVFIPVPGPSLAVASEAFSSCGVVASLVAERGVQARGLP